MEQSKTDFECIGFSEVDKYAKSIYKRHFPGHRDLGDARLIQTSDLGEFDLLVGGFPCQAFSIAGYRRGFDDTRGTLFFEISRILHDKRPRYFLLENVKGLLSHDKGKTFQTILGVLSDLGYDVEWRVLNSKNFGVPQNRERVYIKGHFRERGECSTKILPNSRAVGESGNEINCLKQGRQGYRIFGDDGVNQTLSATGGNSGRSTYILESDARLNIKGTSKYKLNSVYGTDGLSPTLCARDYKGPRMILDEKVRRLMPLECERLQGFPDNWTQYGVDDEKISNTQRYKCCGNAVTTNVITFLMDNWFN